MCHAIFWDDLAALVNGFLICHAHGRGLCIGKALDLGCGQWQVVSLRHLILEEGINNFRPLFCRLVVASVDALVQVRAVVLFGDWIDRLLGPTGELAVKAVPEGVAA